MNQDRRHFLRNTLGTSTLCALTPSVPHFLLNSAAAAADVKGGENILVVVQMSGGNDGINTVIPYADDVYQRSRFATRIPDSQVLKINDYCGLHPSMTGFSELLESNQLSVLQGVGYPNPDRSHFSSMDIWHTAARDSEKLRHRTGWIGRYLDAKHGRNATDIPAIHLGSERQPLALNGLDVRVPSVSSFDGFKLQTGGNAKLAANIEALAKADRVIANNDLFGFLQKSTVSALHSSKQIQRASQQYKSTVQYPTTKLAQKLKSVAQLIDAGMSTRIFYVDHTGFDTHANQPGAHRALLSEMSDGISLFMEDLKAHGHNKRVLVMAFSEFGRRVKENASRGTDHGAAGPMFLAGDKVKAGLIGKHPSMTDLDQGDLKFHTDFRQVYAAVLEQWLRADSKAVLGDTYKPIRALTV